MKRMLTLITMWLCTLMDVHAQPAPPVWSKNYGGIHWDRPHTVRMVGNEIVISGGTNSSSGDFSEFLPGQSDMFLMKTDIQGNIIWKKMYGGSRVELCLAMEHTADGGYILVGSTDSKDGDATNSGYHTHSRPEDEWVPDFWVVKVDASGEIEWQHAYGGSGVDEALGVTQTDDDGDGQKDDGYAIVGYTGSNDGNITGHRGEQDTWVIKLTATGDLVWQKTLGGTRMEFGRDIEQTPDGGYLVLSETYSSNRDVVGYHGGGSTVNQYADWWIVKLNATGTQIEWSRTYGGDFSDVPYEMKLTDDDGDGQKDDGFVIAGATESRNGDVPLPHRGAQDMLTVKFDMNGNVEWRQRVGGTKFERAYSVVQTLDGGYAVLGSCQSGNYDMLGTNARGEYDFMMLKFTANGVLEYKQRFGGSGSDEAMSIQQTPAGCFIMAGASNSNDGDVPGNYGDNADIWVINWCAPVAAKLPVKLTEYKARYESDGKAVLEWSTSTEQNNDRFEIQRSVDGRTYYTIGTVKGAGTTSHTVRYTFTDHSVDALGAEMVYYRLRQVDIDGKSETSPVVLVRPKPKKAGSVKVWPNPSQGRFQVQLKNAPSGQVKATVYNANGHVVMSKTFLNTTNEIDLTGKNAGTYFIRLEDKNGFMQVQQVIVK